MQGPTSLGRWLKQRRHSLDLTQDELAARVGCALETIRKLEVGRRRASRAVAEGLVDALQLPGTEVIAHELIMAVGGQAPCQQHTEQAGGAELATGGRLHPRARPRLGTPSPLVSPLPVDRASVTGEMIPAIHSWIHVRLQG